MGKLTFKGEKKKKKRKIDTEEKQEQPNVNISKKPRLDLKSASGWTSSINEKDLNGPCIFVLPAQKKPLVFSFDEDKDVFVSSKDSLKVNEEAINFLGDDEQVVANVPLFHKVEPTSVCQVFTLVTIKQQDGSFLKKEDKPSQYAFRNHKSRYLGVNPATNAVETTFAIGENSMFGLKKVKTFNEEFKISEVFWQVWTKDGKCVLTYDGEELKFSPIETSKNKQFLIRVQIQNSSKYKLAELLKEEDSSVDVKKVIKDLYDETDGKIKITEDLIKRIKSAIKDGNLNEQIIEEKEKLFSRW